MKASAQQCRASPRTSNSQISPQNQERAWKLPDLLKILTSLTVAEGPVAGGSLSAGAWVPPRNGPFPCGTARGAAGAGAAQEPPVASGPSSWIIPGLLQPGTSCWKQQLLISARNAARTGNSCKSSGTDRSQPSQLGEEPWHRVQAQIFPSPVSAAAQTADGIAPNPRKQPGPLPCRCHAAFAAHPCEHGGAAGGSGDGGCPAAGGNALGGNIGTRDVKSERKASARFVKLCLQRKEKSGHAAAGVTVTGLK